MRSPKFRCEKCGQGFQGQSGHANRFCSQDCAGTTADPTRVAAYRALWDLGLSQLEIARRMGVTANVVAGLAYRNDFPPRTLPKNFRRTRWTKL